VWTIAPTSSAFASRFTKCSRANFRSGVLPRRLRKRPWVAALMPWFCGRWKTSAPGVQFIDPNAATPDAAFDRQWAITLLESALRDLESEMIAENKGRVFELLKPWLTGDAEALNQAVVADELGMKSETLKVQVYRLRKLIRAAGRKRIADTVSGATQASEELQHLMAALRRGLGERANRSIFGLFGLFLPYQDPLPFC
jgi:hypothetical protein